MPLHHESFTQHEKDEPSGTPQFPHTFIRALAFALNLDDRHTPTSLSGVSDLAAVNSRKRVRLQSTIFRVLLVLHIARFSQQLSKASRLRSVSFSTHS